MEGFVFDNVVDKLETNRICLLDADYIKYIVCSRRKKEIEFQNGNNSIPMYNDMDPVIAITNAFLSESIFSKIADPVLFCWSGKSYNTFRNYIAFSKEYKSNRAKDEAYPGESADAAKVVKHIIDNYVTLIFNDLEADDILSVLQDDRTYIMSKDKDLKQVPGMHYDWNTNSIYEISKKEAAYNLAYQLLAGDSTDCIPGFPRIGDKKAKEFLETIPNPRDYVLHVAKKYQDTFGVFKGIDMFSEVWMLVKMRENHGDFFKHKYQKMFDVKDYLIRNKLK